MSFSKYRYFFLALSAIVITGLLVATFVVHGGFRPSITFDGGVRLSLVMPSGQGHNELDAAAHAAGLENFQIRQTDVRANTYDLELGPVERDQYAAIVEQSERERLAEVRRLEREGQPVPPALRLSSTVADYIEARLLPELGIDASSVVARETIAASYGENLSDTARNLLLGTIVVIGLYLTFRFDFPFALGASLALLHDVLMTIGFIGVFQLEPNIPLVAAVLTIIGYSINDTIVIFDRIRENVQDRQQATLGATVDLAITQTLSRTIITSILTFLSVLALLIGGVESLREFALVLGFGIVIGTYSSIFIASPMVQIYEQFRRGRA